MSAASTRAVAAYRRAFGTGPDLLVRAPGRVNLIGEHTDYNDGFVLPLAIDRETVVAAGLTQNGRFTAVAADFDDGRDEFGLLGEIKPTEADWANYVRGMTVAMRREGLAISGGQIAIAGDVPLGSGLSSSASLEIAVGLALAELGNRDVDLTRLAQVGQWAENDFVGCACGIMDQLISARGVAGHALLIDCRSLECTPVVMPVDTAVIIAHSGIRHTHAGGEYNDRRAQCEVAARHYGVEALRDLDGVGLEAGKDGLEDVAYRRARHVVTENARTLAAAEALRSSDLRQLGALMAQSQMSMRDDFEITVPAIDRLADIMAAPLGGEGGARMTGGGFGGCVIAVVPTGKVSAVVAAVAANYRTPDGNAAEVFVCQASAGASRLPREG